MRVVVYVRRRFVTFVIGRNHPGYSPGDRLPSPPLPDPHARTLIVEELNPGLLKHGYDFAESFGS